MEIKRTESNTKNTTKELKQYKSPQLTNYGDISELVLAMGGAGSDGNPIPSLSLT